MTESRAQSTDERDCSAGDVESPKVAAQTGGWVGRQTAGPAPAADQDHVAGGGAGAAGGPGDREYHLARVVAGFPRQLSARRLALLAQIVSDDPP